VVGRDGGPDLVLRIAIGVGADIDLGDELDAIEITEPADAPGGLGLRRDVLL